MGRMRVNDFAQPVRAGDGEVAVLFCHGFTASPGTLRGWALEVADQGFTVSVPRLPGHGTTWQELAVTGWEDWFATVEREYLALAATHRQVFLCGLSMGGALALRLTEHYPDGVAGLVLVNPALVGQPSLNLVGAARHLITSVDGRGSDIALEDVVEHSYPRVPLAAVHSMTRMWADVRARLDLVYCPLLLFRSANDHVIPASSAEIILKQVSSEDLTERVLAHSFHVATRDHDAQQIVDESVAFFRRHADERLPL